MAKFLQDTIEEIGLERRNTKNKQSKAYEFAQFIRRTRTEGSYVSNEEIFKFAKLFEDELTLDSLAMGQLRALCRMLGIQPIGTPEILRFQLMLKLRELKADDKVSMMFNLLIPLFLSLSVDHGRRRGRSVANQRFAIGLSRS